MRIIAGEYKGRRIASVPGDGTRPTTDRVREALASAVAAAFPGGFSDAVVLDAFAGSGALGIEALSRGARFCLFYERDRVAARVIEHNLSDLDISKARALLRRGDIMKHAESDSLSVLASRPFDVVFLDPPYAYGSAVVCSFIEDLARHGDLDAGSLLTYEHATAAFDFEQSTLYGGPLELVSCKKYGSTQISLMRYRAQ